MIYAILVADIAFWVVLLGGLALRYIVRDTRLSSFVLALVPLIDLALLVFVTVDVAAGAPPSWAHALAAVYLGFTVAFGHPTITRTDAWFHHRYAGGPKPVKPAKGSDEALRSAWSTWLRLLVTVAIAVAGLTAMILLEGHGRPGSPGAALRHPYWATAGLLVAIAAGWSLSVVRASRGRVRQRA